MLHFKNFVDFINQEEEELVSTNSPLTQVGSDFAHLYSELPVSSVPVDMPLQVSSATPYAAFDAAAFSVQATPISSNPIYVTAMLAALRKTVMPCI